MEEQERASVELYMEGRASVKFPGVVVDVLNCLEHTYGPFAKVSDREGTVIWVRRDAVLAVVGNAEEALQQACPRLEEMRCGKE